MEDFVRASVASITTLIFDRYKRIMQLQSNNYKLLALGESAVLPLPVLDSELQILIRQDHLFNQIIFEKIIHILDPKIFWLKKYLTRDL